MPFVFNHHDPAASEADYAFPVEGVRRLRDALARPGARNTFVLMHAAPLAEANVAGIAPVLARKPSRNRLVVVAHTSESERPVARLTGESGDNVRIVTLATRNPSFGLRFADSADDALFPDLLRHKAGRPFEGLVEGPGDDGPPAPHPYDASRHEALP